VTRKGKLERRDSTVIERPGSSATTSKLASTSRREREPPGHSWSRPVWVARWSSGPRASHPASRDHARSRAQFRRPHLAVTRSRWMIATARCSPGRPLSRPRTAPA
jgi:hypothetical protein